MAPLCVAVGRAFQAQARRNATAVCPYLVPLVTAPNLPLSQNALPLQLLHHRTLFFPRLEATLLPRLWWPTKSQGVDPAGIV